MNTVENIISQIESIRQRKAEEYDRQVNALYLQWRREDTELVHLAKAVEDAYAAKEKEAIVLDLA